MYKMYLQKSTFLFCNYVHFMLAKNNIVQIGICDTLTSVAPNIIRWELCYTSFLNHDVDIMSYCRDDYYI